MRDADRAGSISRRDFLRRATVTAAAASASLIVGEQMWEAFEAFGPRRLLVAGLAPETVLIAAMDGATISAMLTEVYRSAVFPIGQVTSLRTAVPRITGGRRWRGVANYGRA